MIYLYRLGLMPLTVLLLPMAALLNPKIKAGLKLRLKREAIPDFLQKPIWIHAASGEFEYAKPVIRELKAQFPEIPVVVTYFSPTYAESIRKFGLVDFSCPLPLDLPGPCFSFIKRLNPRVLLIARTDLWPELLTKARQQGVPSILFSCTQKPITSPLKKWLALWRMKLVDRIICVSKEDQRNLADIGLTATIAGDTRYDQVATRLNAPKPLLENLKPKSTPTLIIGSSWLQDELTAIEALKDLVANQQLKLIIVPHEPTAEHLKELKSLLDRAGLKLAIYSEGQPWDTKDVLIVDKIGILAELYTWADMALIGGSFKGSVHSVMEAIGAGLRVIVGPYHHNNREALEFQSVSVGKNPVVKAVAGAEEFKAYVTQLLTEPTRFKTEKTEIKQEFTRKLGATHELLRFIDLGSNGAVSASQAGDESLHL